MKHIATIQIFRIGNNNRSGKYFRNITCDIIHNFMFNPNMFSHLGQVEGIELPVFSLLKGHHLKHFHPERVVSFKERAERG